MAGNCSFDITTGCDLQEVDNAVNQSLKELTQRYDFKGVKFELTFTRADNKLAMQAPDEHKLAAIWDVVQTKMVRRKVPIKNLKVGKIVPSSGGSVRQEVDLQQGIPIETAKEIVKFIKEKKLKKVQGEIQKDQVRIASPSIDALQEIMALLKAEDFGIELTFGNYRS